MRAFRTVVVLAGIAACRAAVPQVRPDGGPKTVGRRAGLGLGLAAACAWPRPGGADPPRISERVTVPGTVSPNALSRGDGGGVRVDDETVGAGPAVDWGQVLKVRLSAYTRVGPDGPLRKFMATPAYLVRHGNGRVVRGLDEGLHTMRVGGARRIEAPAALGYTAPGLGPLPVSAGDRRQLSKALDEMDAAGGAVVFDVALLDAWEDDADQGFYRDEEFPDEVLAEIARRAKEIGKGLK